MIAVASRSFSSHPQLRAALFAHSPDVRFNDEGKALAGEELVEFLSGCDKAIIGLEPVTAEVLDKVPTLKVISKYGVGLNNLDLDTMMRKGVNLGWTPGVNARSVAELTLSFMILLLHRVPEVTRIVKAGEWRQMRGRELHGRTVGILGCGHVGKQVVRLLGPFDCRILVHDIRSYDDFYAEWHVKPVSLEQLLQDSETLTVHLPLDSSTRGILDRDHIGLMKRGAVLVNTARGGIVDEDAVADAIESGLLSGAAFDVLAQEPPVATRLLKLNSVVTTSHIGGSSEEAVLEMGRAAIRGLDSAKPIDVHLKEGQFALES